VSGAARAHHGGVADVEDTFYRKLANFEEGFGVESRDWLGGPAGLALALGLAAISAGATILFWGRGFDSHTIVRHLGSVVWIVTLAGALAFWRRQRLAAHFQAARRRLGSADPGERQRGFTELLINARRGWAEHRRIARVLTDYLRHPPRPDPDERTRRHLAFSMLADQTLVVRAKEKLDLSGAVLHGVRAPSAELPGVCLRDADLTGARLAGANLEGADLRGARLDGVDLTGARLDGALRT
jgi:hypothetical protein